MIDARSFVSNPNGNKGMGVVVGYAIHHSVTQMPATATEQQELAHIKSIDAYHAGLDYGGFAYHMAAFASGRAYLCGSMFGQRAHVARRNHELLGIVAIGDFSAALPEKPQLDALRECLQLARETYGPLSIRGHNDWALPGQGTICAGLLNNFDWGQVAPPTYPTNQELAHAAHWLYACYFNQDRKLLHPWDAGVISRALDWYRAK